MDMGKDIVREGYNVVGAEYTAARMPNPHELSFVQDLIDRLREGAGVLDVGCGGGVPVALRLMERLDITGVDISERQIEAARTAAPSATFVCKDMSKINFPDSSFDAIYSLYAVIHVPREEHRTILMNFHRLLRPGGFLLLCTGAGDLPEDVSEYFGQDMYWSHYNAETNLATVRECGFEVLRWELVGDTLDPEIESKHLFLMAEKPA
jgi:2-polyprenyl-3-methyl-5-hydroxy-6-metoxy-1,4-benzoquinol methylase